MSCNKTSNNKYFDCPALMEDGRAFTDYRPNSYIDDTIRIQNRVFDSYSYRQFLIHNGLNIMKINNQQNEMKNGCSACSYNNIPTESTCIYNKQFGLCTPNANDGIGQNNISSTL
jgi:hypothetical protein